MIDSPALAFNPRAARCELAADDLWIFCQLLAPDFYTDDRPHLRVLCDTLQALWSGELLRPDGQRYRKLIIEMPPRFGKSRTLTMFTAWIMGREHSTRVMTACYNDELAQDFSKYTRNIIAEERNVDVDVVYADIFTAQIKFGDSAYHRWALAGQYFNYKGAGIGGSVTGKGAGVLIVDDPVKSEAEARSPYRLESIWNWYTGTWLSRAEEDALQVVCMTPWVKDDLTSRLVKESADEWYVLSLPAWTERAGFLCPKILPEEEYEDRKRNMDPQIFAANFLMQRIDIAGRLYNALMTYDELPRGENGEVLSDARVSYTDTADEGADYLCHIAAVRWERMLYVTDIVYTKAPQEQTEPAVCNSITNEDTRKAQVESNNGGRAFARNVMRLIQEAQGLAHVTWFHQSKNKRARILTNASTVQQFVRFPVDWRYRWPGFYEALSDYQREGKNTHDDAPDALTGLVEHFGPSTKREIEVS